MTKQVQRRRGTTAQHTGFTGAEGEITVNTTNKSAVVHDGATAGGVEAARADLANVDGANIASTISGETVASLTVTSADINGGTIDSTTVGASTPSSGAFTTLTTTGGATIGGDLTVNGTTTTINSTTLTVDDLNVTLASGAADAAAANGAGITVDGASATFNYASTGDKWTMNKPLDVTGGVVTNKSLTINSTDTFGFIEMGGSSGAYIDMKAPASDDYDARILYTAGGNLQISTFADEPILLRQGLSTKLATTATGVDVTGVITTDGMTTSANINFGDNDRAIFGAASDLQIYSNGTNSFITEQGTGSLYISATNLNFRSTALETYLTAVDNGAVTLYHDNAPKLATTSTGIDVTGTVTADTLSLNSSTDFGIGTISSDSNWGMYLRSDNVGGSDPAIADFNFASNANEHRLRIGSGGDIAFYDSTGVSQGFFWDASTQRLGLGETSPESTLTVRDSGAEIRLDDASNNPVFRFMESGTSKGKIETTAGDMRFYAGGVLSSNRHMTITSAGNVGIGTASPARQVHLHNSSGDNNLHITNSTTGATATDGFSIVSQSSTNDVLLNQRETANMRFFTGNTERMRIDSDGNVGIGTSSPSQPLSLYANDTSDTQLIIEQDSTGDAGIQFSLTGVKNWTVGVDNSDGDKFKIENGPSIGGSNDFVIDSDGNVLMGTTIDNPAASNVQGHALRKNSRAEFSNGGGVVVYVNRQEDGSLVSFRSAGTGEGSISVSGTTVSYNGGHLARWSRLADNSKDTSIVKGTVMTNLDEMVEWSHETTYWTDEDELPDGVSVGDVKTAAYVEDNEQLNKMAVSSVEGDANVAGVFVNWDDDDDWNDMNIAMTGDMVIRIAQGTTVARGDLLMSAGDGTAKPQGDDIVRSKTIAKVTSTHVSHTYDDGSYLVPCVLMAC